MNQQQCAHIEPSRHSTHEVDAFLRLVEANIDAAEGAGSPAIKPNRNLDESGAPISDTPKNPKM